jgi:hypothetical protein
MQVILLSYTAVPWNINHLGGTDVIISSTCNFTWKNKISAWSEECGIHQDFCVEYGKQRGDGVSR